jgi:hypothetical protein
VRGGHPTRRARKKKKRPITIPIYETETGGNARRSRTEDTAIQTCETNLAEGVDFGDGSFVYVVLEDEEISQFGDAYIGTIEKNYLFQYLRGEGSNDTVYGIRRETEEVFKIGDSTISVEANRDVTIRCETYEGTEGLWKLLTKTRVDRSLITPYDMTSYKRVHESTSEHLNDNDHWKTLKPPEGRSTETSKQNTSLRRAGGGVGKL